MRNNDATLCCAKNRRCESSRVTSPLESRSRQTLVPRDQVQPHSQGPFLLLRPPKRERLDKKRKLGTRGWAEVRLLFVISAHK